MNCGMPDASKYLKDLNPKKKDVQAFLRLNEIKANIVDFVENGNNLFISSTTSQNGKTTWSLKIMYKYFDEIWAGSDFVPRGYFLYVPEFIDNARLYQYKETSEYKEIDKVLKTADLVIWDNITQNRLLENDQNLLNKYINKRFMEGKTNIFNGSLPEDLEQQVGKTLAEKLKLCEQVTLKGTYIK